MNAGNAGIFSENSRFVTGSIQKTSLQTIPAIVTPGPTPITTYQMYQRSTPTPEPDLIRQIERVVSSQPEIDIHSLEQRIHEKINQQRVSHGIPSLRFDSSLTSIARKHSEDMARNNFFSHDNLQGLGPSERGIRAGYSCYKNYGSYYMTGLAENIMQDNLYTTVTYYNGIPSYDWNSQEELAESVVSGWMTSPVTGRIF